MSGYALQFSGGMDSLACLWLLRDSIDLTVYWGKTDGAYPGMEEYVKQCCDEAHLPLKIVEGNRNIAEHGYPVDSDPETAFECCRRGLWEPMHQAMIDDGISTIYRGQRDDDFLKAAINSGYKDDRGIEYVFPIATWSREEVINYLLRSCARLMPASYWSGEITGRDCWDCTGYLFDNAQRILNLPSDRRELVLKEIKDGCKLA